MIQTIKGTATGRVDNIDNTPPNIAGISAQASTADTSVAVTLQAQDAESGITQIDWKYKKGSDPWMTQTDYLEQTTSSIEGTGSKNTSFSHQFTDLEEGTNYTFQATVTNAAGANKTTTENAEATTITKGITPTIGNIGDYVDYPIDINGDGSYTEDWRIFYVGQTEDGSANERVFLIAADFVTNECGELGEAVAKSGMVAKEEGYEACFYWQVPPPFECNDGLNSPSTMKAQCSFPDLFMPANPYCTAERRFLCSNSGKSSSKCAGSLQCSENWSSFTVRNSADKATGGPTINMWVESWNAKHGKEIILYANGASTYGYYVSKHSADGTEAGAGLYDFDGYNDTLYFPHKTKEVDLNGDGATGQCWGYWLASPSSGTWRDGINLLTVGYAGSIIDHGYTTCWFRDSPGYLFKTWCSIEGDQEYQLE